MRILFDQGTPVPLRSALTAHTISTAHEMGWSGLDNGALLKAAEENFDTLITTDKNLRHQQELKGPTVSSPYPSHDKLAEAETSSVPNHCCFAERIVTQRHAATPTNSAPSSPTKPLPAYSNLCSTRTLYLKSTAGSDALIEASMIAAIRARARVASGHTERQRLQSFWGCGSVCVAGARHERPDRKSDYDKDRCGSEGRGIVTPSAPQPPKDAPKHAPKWPTKPR
jgi:hypothetical protein